MGLVTCAEAVLVSGAREYAEVMSSRLQPWAGQLDYNGVTSLGPVSHYLGGLAAAMGRFDEAERCFASAAALNERVGATFFAAHTDVAWGTMLAERAARGDAERARALLTKALSNAAEHGYAVVARDASRVLGQLPLPLRTP